MRCICFNNGFNGTHCLRVSLKMSLDLNLHDVYASIYSNIHAKRHIDITRKFHKVRKRKQKHDDGDEKRNSISVRLLA
jgi:hypothetical protein